MGKAQQKYLRDIDAHLVTLVTFLGIIEHSL